MPKFYQFGGESIAFAGRWNGYSMPSYRAAENRALSGTYPTALTQNGGYSLLSTGPERAQLNDGPSAALSGILSLSDNEKTLAIVAGVAVAGFVGWKLWKGRKR